jgi:hypothetical protein
MKTSGKSVSTTGTCNVPAALEKIARQVQPALLSDWLARYGIDSGDYKRVAASHCVTGEPQLSMPKTRQE